MKKTLLLPCLLVLLAALPLRAQIPIQGRVVAPDGRGIAGVRVELRPVLRVYERGLRELQGLGEPAAAARTVSGAEGEFFLTAPEMGTWWLLLQADGFVAMQSNPFPVFDDVHLLPAEMQPDRGLRVRIAGSDGSPLAGARVRAFPEPGSSLPSQGWRTAERNGVSGPDGALRLSRAAGEALRLWILAPGYPAQEPAQEHPASADGAVLKLERGAPGRLWVSRSGKAVPGALVREAQSGFLLGQSDERGNLDFEAPKSGAWEARIEPRDARATVFPIRNPLQKTVNLTLPLPLRIEGRVLDRGTGKPLAGAWVWALDDPAALARTDATGTYSLDGLTPSWVWLVAAAPGYFWNNASYLIPEKSASRSAPALALAASGALAGTVVDEDGQPLAGVRIRGLAAGGEGETERFRASTSAQGRFRVSSLGEGSYALILSHPGFAAERENVSLAPGERRTDLRFLLRPGRGAAGLLVDEDGEPVAGAEVELVRSVTAARAIDDEALAEDRLFQATTGSDGRFQLVDLPAGWFELNIRHRDFQSLREKALELPREASVEELGTFVLKRGAALQGRVRDPSGAPLAGAEVWASPASDSPAARTGSDGSFRIQGLDPEASVVLEICRRGHLTLGLSFEAVPAEPVEVTLPLAARLTGRVVALEGEPLPGAQVRAFLERAPEAEYSPMSSSSSPCPQNSGLAEAWTGPDGGFILESLEPGRFHLTATADGYLSATQSGVEVRPDGENRVPDLALERGAILLGRVLAPDGSPVAGAAVRAAGKRSQPRGFTDGDGNYRLHGVEPGKVQAEALHEEQGHASEEAVIFPGENRLDLRLAKHPRRVVRGRVTGPDGEPVEGALIETREDPFNYGTTYSGADGAFALEIGEREIALWAFQEGLSPGRAAIPAGDTAPQNLEIRLVRSASITGRLLGLDPAELQRATVSANHENFLERQATVDREGRFRIADVAPGNWSLSAESGGRNVEVRVALAPGEEVVVDLALPPTPEED